MIVKLLLAAGVSILLHFVAKGLARWMPAERPADLGEVPADMIARAAARANRIGTLGALGTFLVLCPAWIVGFTILEPLFRPAVAADEMTLSVMPTWRIFRGMGAAYVLAGWAGMWLMRLWIGRTYYLSLAAGDIRYGFRASRFLYWTIVWVLPWCLEFELHALGTYALFTKNAHVERHSLLWPATERTWNALTTIELAKPYREHPATIGRSPECRLTFGDGHRFTDVPWLAPFQPDGTRVKWEHAARFASRQSGVAVQITPRIE